jgi:hypothetical protein
MSANKRSKNIRASNLALISRMQMEGFTRQEICDRINTENEGIADPITVNQITADLIKCKQIWARTIPWTQNEMRIAAKAELERVKRQAWKAYEASCLNSNRTIATIDSATRKPKGDIQLIQEVRHGDANQLRVVMECVDMENKLFGLYPREPIEIVGQKKINVAFIVDTKGKSLREVADFPVEGNLHPPQLQAPDAFGDNGGDADTSGNGEEP